MTDPTPQETFDAAVAALDPAWEHAMDYLGRPAPKNDIAPNLNARHAEDSYLAHTMMVERAAQGLKIAWPMEKAPAVVDAELAAQFRPDVHAALVRLLERRADTLHRIGVVREILVAKPCAPV